MKVRMSELDLIGLGDEIWEDLQGRVEGAAVEAAEVIVAEGRRNLSRMKGTKRTAAPAGESPEYDEGELHDSLKLLGGPRRSKYGVRQNYGSDHPGAGTHEFGGTITQGGVTRVYPPRPYVRPAEEQAQGRIDQILEDL